MMEDFFCHVLELGNLIKITRNILLQKLPCSETFPLTNLLRGVEVMMPLDSYKE